MKTRELQTLLVKHGFNPGKVDGKYGPKTEAALIAFKKSKGFKARAYLGPLTKAALREGVVAKKTEAVTGRKSRSEQPPWMRLAYSFLGLKEIRGKQHNKKIVGWWEALGLHFRDDETPWCAGFMNRMVQMAGLAIPKKYRAAALGWRWAVHGTRLQGPAVGAVFTITRPGKPGSGHTGFVAGKDSKGNVMILGGNQGNAVSINPYHPTARDARYYWPEGYPLPGSTGMKTLPVINSGGRHLTNEA